MSSASGAHDQDHADRVLLFALQAISPSAVRAVEAQISGCTDCRKEMARLRPVVDTFVGWPTDVLRPSASLWERLVRRVTVDARPEPASSAPPRWTEPEWQEVAPGISVKLLATDAERDRVSMLVRLAPDVDYPPHCHAGVEELHLLAGELMIDGRRLFAGDYHRADPGSVDHRVWSETGCTCLLVTSPSDVLR